MLHLYKGNCIEEELSCCRSLERRYTLKQKQDCNLHTMEKSTFVLMVIGAVLATLIKNGHCQGYKPTCDKNMESSECGASCPKTCEDVARMEMKVCDMMCKPGCVCKSGYVLKGNVCVVEKSCPCNKNASYKGCANCRRTCDDVTNMGKPVPKMCAKDCELGCTCNEGYVFHSGKCILEKDCPCPANAHYSDCGTGCPVTCENYTAAANSYSACATKCGKGCFCNEKFVKKGEKGECVDPKTCGYSG